MLPFILFFYICISIGSINGHAIIHAPPPGYYCYLQCINKCLATPPRVKTNDLLELCKTEICWPMTPDESYCDPTSRKCFTGSCKPSDVGWIAEKSVSMKAPLLSSKRRHEKTDTWRLQWETVPGAIFYAVYHWKEGANSSSFYHEEVRDTWFLSSLKNCEQNFARVAAISTTGMSPFSDVTKAYAFFNESEEVLMKLTMKSASLVPLPYYYDPILPFPANDPTEPVEPSTLILTIGYHVESRGWVDQDVLDLIDYAFLPVSCPPSDNRLDLTSLKPKTVNGQNEFILNLPGSIAQRKCKFLFSVKSISAPCGRTVRVVHTTPDNDDGVYGLWATLDCEKIDNAVCQDDPNGILKSILHSIKIDEPPPGEEPKFTKDDEETTFSFQIPRDKIGQFFDNSGIQQLAILVAFLVAIPVGIFFLITCFIKNKQKQKQLAQM